MSRIGKLPISIPAGVSVTLKDDVVTVKGPKGELSQYVNPLITVEVADNQILLTRKDDEKQERAFHEDPQVPNYGKRGYGTLLKKGLCIAIEPMITLGSREIVMERDGWTVRTKDRKTAAHFEHTIAIGPNGADILSSFDFIEQVLGDKAI